MKTGEICITIVTCGNIYQQGTRGYKKVRRRKPGIQKWLWNEWFSFVRSSLVLCGSGLSPPNLHFRLYSLGFKLSATIFWTHHSLNTIWLEKIKENLGICLNTIFDSRKSVYCCECCMSNAFVLYMLVFEDIQCDSSWTGICYWPLTIDSP